MLPVIILAAIAIPLLVIAFLAVRRSANVGEHPVNQTGSRPPSHRGGVRGGRALPGRTARTRAPLLAPRPTAGRRMPHVAQRAGRPAAGIPRRERTDQDRPRKDLPPQHAVRHRHRHGTMFVGCCREQRPLAEMLKSMLGLPDGIRDTLTRYTQPVTGRLLLRAVDAGRAGAQRRPVADERVIR